MPGQEKPGRSNRTVAHSCQAVGRAAETGFTLVEAMVTVIISSVLLGVLLMVMMMNNNGVKDGAVNAQVQSQYETTMEEIGTAARNATAVLDAAANSPVETFPPAATLTAATTSKIEMYKQDANGTVTKIRGFWADNGVLKEWKPGVDYQPFVIGSWPALSVVESAPFQLSADRKTLTVSMSVTGVFSGNTAVAPARGGVFLCRN